MKYKKYLRISFLLFFVFLQTKGIAEALDNHLLNRNIQTVITHDRIKYHLPNLSVSIILPGELMPINYVSGYYSFRDKKKITPKSLFKIGSITKTFTATIVLQLVEKNKLQLNDRLEKWFPQYTRWKNITVENLLLNTSGIYDYVHNNEDVWRDLKNNPDKQWKMEKLTDLAYHYPDYFKPGQGYHYSNTDYVLLGMIIEKVTHQTIQSVFEQYFRRYHLSNTYLNLSAVPKNRLAHGFNRDGTFPYNSDVTFINTSLGLADGAIITTPDDLTKWLLQLFNNKVVSTESFRRMTMLISSQTGQPLKKSICSIKKEALKNSWVEIGDGTGMGLVYFKNTGFNWMHSGGILGYESLYAYNPCKGIYLVLFYGAKPKQQFIFMDIAKDLFSVMNHSDFVNKKINLFQKTHPLPKYCKC